MNSKIKLGPIALLFVVIAICLTILALLNFSAASADKRLAEKYAETVRIRYELEAEGQALLAGFANGQNAVDKEDSLDTAGDDLYTITDGPGASASFELQENGNYKALLEKDGMRLHIEVEADADGSDLKVLSWVIDKEWAENTNMNVWPGF